MRERFASFVDWLRLDQLDHVLRDVRYALRGLRRSPEFTATVVLTLGLGIGANAAMFGVIDRLMFRPFPYLRDPATVNRVYLQTTSRGRVNTQSGFPYTRYVDLKRWTTSLSQYAGFTEWRLAVGSDDAARERQVAGVNAAFFGFFDATPVLGRFFSAGEDLVPRGADVAVLGYGFWKTAFGGRNVIGQTIQVGPLVTTIIGVAPRGFVGVSEGEAPAVFVPITTLAYGVNQGDAKSFATRYNWDWMSVMVRRRPGVSAATATADLTHAFVQSRDAQRAQSPTVAPATIARPRAIAGALKTAGGPDAGLESRTLVWVTGMAVIVLLIACANVANLMFARVLRRRREIAMRLALGVSRRRLIGQFLTEALILAAIGCVVGLAIAQWMSLALRRLLLHDGSPGVVFADWRTVLAATAAAVVAALFASVGPALVASRGDLATSLRAGARDGTYQRSHIRSALLIVQGTLSVILLVGAGLFVRSLDNVRSMRLGWDPEPVLVITPNYRGLQMSSSERDAFRGRLLDAARSIPGVRFAARINSLPFGTNTFELHVAGVDSVQRLGRFVYQATTRDYFDVLDTRVIRGRSFMSQDGAASPRVMVISESMGRALWPGRDPIGQCARVGSDTAPCHTVIGIAEDAVQNSLSDTDRFMYYMSDEQPPHRPSNRIFVRMADRNSSRHVEEVRRAMQRVMPAPAYVTVSPLEDLVETQRRSWRLGATMFVAFGALALAVAAVGLYGVIAYNVAQRLHELGVRVALGARSRDIVTLVAMQGIWFGVAGVAIGLTVALSAARWIQPLLFRESARDPVIFVGVAALTCLVAVASSAVPAMRGTRADPNTALRGD